MDNIEKEEWFRKNLRRVRKSGLWALIGICFVTMAAISKIKALFLGGILILPILFWLNLIPLLHWKEYYKGDKSNLWGALLLIETSGWFKIVYWFRHVLKDRKGLDRYTNHSTLGSRIEE